MKQLTEAEAWREIAANIEKGAWEYRGLCLEANNVTAEVRGVPGAGLRGDMRLRVVTHMKEMEETFVDSTGSAGYFAEPGEADVRVLAALFLALEAEDDEALFLALEAEDEEGQQRGAA